MQLLFKCLTSDQRSDEGLFYFTVVNKESKQNLLQCTFHVRNWIALEKWQNTVYGQQSCAIQLGTFSTTNLKPQNSKLNYKYLNTSLNLKKYRHPGEEFALSISGNVNLRE